MSLICSYLIWYVLPLPTLLLLLLPYPQPSLALIYFSWPARLLNFWHFDFDASEDLIWIWRPNKAATARKWAARIFIACFVIIDPRQFTTKTMVSYQIDTLLYDCQLIHHKLIKDENWLISNFLAFRRTSSWTAPWTSCGASRHSRSSPICRTWSTWCQIFARWGKIIGCQIIQGGPAPRRPTILRS